MARRKLTLGCCVAGMESTGSTYVWQIVTAISGRRAKKIHSHSIGNSMYFVSYRDPRDIICSYAKRLLTKKMQTVGMEAALIRAHQILFQKFRRQDDLAKFVRDIKLKRKVFLIKYEDYFCGNESKLFDFIATKIGAKFNDRVKNKILDKFSIEKNKQRSKKFSGFGKYDKKTLIHGNHISGDGKIGVWKDLFTENVCELVKKDLGQFLIEFGYEKDLSWGISKEG